MSSPKKKTKAPAMPPQWREEKARRLDYVEIGGDNGTLVGGGGGQCLREKMVDLMMVLRRKARDLPGRVKFTPDSEQKREGGGGGKDARFTN